MRKLFVFSVLFLGCSYYELLAQLQTTSLTLVPSSTGTPGPVIWRQPGTSNTLSLRLEGGLGTNRVAKIIDIGTNQTVLSYNDDGDVGFSGSSRNIRTIFTTNIDAAPPGTGTAYIKSPKFEISDTGGNATAFWEMSASMTAGGSGGSSWQLTDNLGAAAIVARRAFMGSPDNRLISHMDIVPNVNSGRNLGRAGEIWNEVRAAQLSLATGVFSHLNPVSDNTYDLGNGSNRWRHAYFSGNVTIDGTCTGCVGGNYVTLDTPQTITGAKNLNWDTIGTGASGAGVGSAIEVGIFATGNRYSFLDFHGDDTYSDFGLRIIRNNGGANTGSYIQHRGLGALHLMAYDAGVVRLNTNNTDRWDITSLGHIHPHADNTYDLGHAGGRARGGWFYSVDVAPTGVGTSYVKTPKLEISDTGGNNTVFWEQSSAINASTSQWQLTDSLGAAALTANRKTAGAANNELISHMNIMPISNASLNLGKDGVAWNQAYITQLKLLSGIFSNVKPIGDNIFDIGDGSNRWRDFTIGRDGYIGGGLNVTGVATVGGLVTPSFNSALITTQALNAAPGTTPSTYVKARKFEFVDETGAGFDNTIKWDMYANISSSASDLVMRDNAGTEVFKFIRKIAGLAANDGYFSVNVLPGSDAVYNLGNASRRWIGRFSSITSDTSLLGTMNGTTLSTTGQINAGTNLAVGGISVISCCGGGSTVTAAFTNLTVTGSCTGCGTAPNMVTTDTIQSITGAKTFSSTLTLSNTANLAMNARVVGDWAPSTSGFYSLGTASLHWSTVHADHVASYGAVAATTSVSGTHFNATGSGPYRINGISGASTGGTINCANISITTNSGLVTSISCF